MIDLYRGTGFAPLDEGVESCYEVSSGDYCKEDIAVGSDLTHGFITPTSLSCLSVSRLYCHVCQLLLLAESMVSSEPINC